MLSLTRNSGRAILSFALIVGRPSSFSLAFLPRVPTAVRAFTSTTTNLAMTKKVLVPIGEGSEEIETTCITDTLTRFGAEVTVASVMKGQLVCKMSRGIKVSLQDYCYYLFTLDVLDASGRQNEHLSVD